MLMRQAAITVAFVIASSLGFATTTTATQTPVTTVAQAAPAQTTEATAATNTAPSTTSTPTNTTPSLRQNQGNVAPLPPTLATLQQKHSQELATQEKRLAVLEQANQEALAKNQELQISNDSLAVQVQVLQSERSAQMFLYGAVTFGVGIFVGILIYSVLYARRRRSW